MQRIGFVASKMSKGNLWTYNLFVVLISFLCSVLVFLVSGFAMLAGLFLVSMVARVVTPDKLDLFGMGIVGISLGALAVLVGLLNIIAIIRNIKLSK